MKISKVLGRLRELADALLESDSNVNKAMLYAAARILMNHLENDYTFEDDCVPDLLIAEYVGVLESHLLVLSGYASSLRHPLDQHHSWAIIAISNLESPICLGPLIERQKGEY